MSSARTVFGVLLLVAGSALWFLPELGARGPGPDEIAYFQGFELAMHGVSPYEAPRYLYTPVFARVGAWLLSHFGFFATAVGLRLLNLGAACVLAFGAFSAVPSLRHVRFPLTALTLALFRPITTALVLGNLSPVAAALTFAGLATTMTFPVPAGVLLALGLAIKPSGLPALVLLATYRPLDGSRRHLVAAAVALAVALALYLSVDAHLLGAMLGHTEPLDSNTNLSLGRVLAAMKLDLPAGVWASVVIAACALWGRARSIDSNGLIAVAGLASLLWLPRVWLHSFSFVLPAVAFAMGSAREALRAAQNLESREGPARARDARSRAMLTATWTLLGVTCLELADAVGDLGIALPFLPWNPAFHAAIPLLAALLLTRVAVRGDR